MPRPRGLRAFARRVAEAGSGLADVSDATLREAAAEVGLGLRRSGLRDPLVVRSFALVCEATRRTLGLSPYDVQIQGAAVLIAGGLVELETGEGKTLTATLPACTAALAGLPVHVITVNDYLVERDAELTRPVYAALGLSSSAVFERATDTGERRAAWACDVVYATGKQAAFDYLRDRQCARAVAGAPGPLLQARGLGLAIVDEADSILVDEARTPLVLARAGAAAPVEARCRALLQIAAALAPGDDFVHRHSEETLELTANGRARIGALLGAGSGLAAWGELAVSERGREEIVRHALVAHHLLRRDVHYVVREGRIELVDPHTGRALPDRSWERGLHQLVEVKEGCPLTLETESISRISYPRFFRRYARLCGMTGTAREVAGELRRVYGLRTRALAPRLPLRRERFPDRAFPTATERDAALLARVRALHQAGRPVLVGTQSVARSEALSCLLHGAGLPHALLNARQDRREAEIIGCAGERAAITVATNMAGRGADIRLGPGVEALGGLHVIAAERGEARRLDRQLLGRAGRQGDPGSGEVWCCLEDDLLKRVLASKRLDTAGRRLAGRGRIAAALRLLLARATQRALEHRHARLRRTLLDSEDDFDRALAFAGRRE